MSKKGYCLFGLIVLLETVATIYDIMTFGIGMFRYYTIDSNLLLLFVGVMTLAYAARHQSSPLWLHVCHLIAAVALTITFFIALLVLAPQEGFAYYFLENVAPINHAIAPLLSVMTFLFIGNEEKMPKYVISMPAIASLTYGVIALILNAVHVIVGPYFFLDVYHVAFETIGMWFAIIAILCLILSVIYYVLRYLFGKKDIVL